MAVPKLLPGSAGAVPATAGPRRPWRARGRIAALVAVILVLAGIGLFFLVTPTRRPPVHTLPTTGYAVSCLAVGAAAHMPGQTNGSDLRLFEQLSAQVGPFTMRRSFDQVLPSSFSASAAGGDAAAGVHTFVSWKPPAADYRGATAGRYDRRIAAWARSVPRTGVYATAFHEPENNMSASAFVAFQRHVYTVVKAANPTIHWGPVYMAYWWDPSQLGHYVGDPKAWWPGNRYADFSALDWYGFTPQPMTTSASFVNWFRTMSPLGKPLLITEYGQYFRPAGQPAQPNAEQARAQAIRQDGRWIFAHPQFKVWMYWEGGDQTGGWQMSDAGSQLAWRSIAERGCPG